MTTTMTTMDGIPDAASCRYPAYRLYPLTCLSNASATKGSGSVSHTQGGGSKVGLGVALLPQILMRRGLVRRAMHWSACEHTGS
jgi:hypothetical protein